LARDIFRQKYSDILLFNSQKTKRVEHLAAGGNTLRGPCAVTRVEEENDIVCVFIRAVSSNFGFLYFG